MAQLLAGHLTISQDTVSELNPSYRLLLGPGPCNVDPRVLDRKSTRLNSSHVRISYAVFCLKKKIDPGFAYHTINSISISALFVERSADHLDLHSFPTRRSSDLRVPH